MVATIKIKGNTVQLQKAFAELSKKIPKVTTKALARASAFQISAIKNRTQSKGLDVNNNPFKPYSKGYKRAKVKQSGVVDLTDSGRMFSSLTSKIKPSQGTLFFRNQRQNRKAFFHNEAGAGRGKVIREFFGATKDEEKKIESILVNMLDKELRL